MKIKDISSNLVPFGNLEPGEVFRYEGKVSMKIPPAGYKVVAINLEDGRHWSSIEHNTLVEDLTNRATLVIDHADEGLVEY